MAFILKWIIQVQHHRYHAFRDPRQPPVEHHAWVFGKRGEDKRSRRELIQGHLDGCQVQSITAQIADPASKALVVTADFPAGPAQDANKKRTVMVSNIRYGCEIGPKDFFEMASNKKPALSRGGLSAG